MNGRENTKGREAGPAGDQPNRARSTHPQQSVSTAGACVPSRHHPLKGVMERRKVMAGIYPWTFLRTSTQSVAQRVFRG